MQQQSHVNFYVKRFHNEIMATSSILSAYMCKEFSLQAVESSKLIPLRLCLFRFVVARFEQALTLAFSHDWRCLCCCFGHENWFPSQATWNMRFCFSDPVLHNHLLVHGFSVWADFRLRVNLVLLLQEFACSLFCQLLFWYSDLFKPAVTVLTTYTLCLNVPAFYKPSIFWGTWSCTNMQLHRSKFGVQSPSQFALGESSITPLFRFQVA